MIDRIIALKVDVDTERGTRIGVKNLTQLFDELNIPATFLFSLGPDNTGKAIKRIFRKGFLKKVSRTNVLKVYGLRTLLNGVILPAPHIGRRHSDILRSVKNQGYEVGIHCYDHIRWQDHVHAMRREEVFQEFAKAREVFEGIFQQKPRAAGAAGWQANANSLAAYDSAGLLYGSDARGTTACFPAVDAQLFETLQIPTNLPTWDELIGRPEYPLKALSSYYSSCLKFNYPNILTLHAEVEGMYYLENFRIFLTNLKNEGVEFKSLESIATEKLTCPQIIPQGQLVQKTVDGRSGKVAVLEI